MNNLPPPKCAVIIPNFNYGRYIEQAIKSVQSQSLNNFEAVIVDDGSTDNSIEIIESAIANDARFRLIKKANGGVARARNTGIEATTAPYVCALDADDAFGHVDFLKFLAEALDEDRACGVAFTGLRVMDDNGNLAPSNSAWPDGWDYDRFVTHVNQVPTCALFRRIAWERAGGYRTELEPAEDANLFFRMGMLGFSGKHVVRDGLFHYRDHANSLSKVRPQTNWRNFAWVHDGLRPFAAQGKAPRGSFPVRNYDTPQVSIIIPVGKGHGELLRRALDSVEAQTERYWECIVISDGETVPRDSYTWVKYAETGGVGRGASAARNIGLQLAKAPLVTFLDADDYWHPRYLEKTLQAYRRSGRYIYTDWLSLSKNGEQEVHATENYDPDAIFRKASIHSINVLMRRKDALEVGGFDETLETWEDPDFFMKLATKGICGERLPEALIAYDYTTGTLREKALTMETQLKKLLYTRYQSWIEGVDKVCCADTLKGKPSAADNAIAAFSLSGEAHPEFGRMVTCEYRGAGAGKEVIGSVSRQRYQYRESGEIFSVWAVDVEASPDMFIPLAVEDTIEETPMPPAPELV